MVREITHPTQLETATPNPAGRGSTPPPTHQRPPKQGSEWSRSAARPPVAPTLSRHPEHPHPPRHPHQSGWPVGRPAAAPGAADAAVPRAPPPCARPTRRPGFSPAKPPSKRPRPHWTPPLPRRVRVHTHHAPTDGSPIPDTLNPRPPVGRGFTPPTPGGAPARTHAPYLSRQKIPARSAPPAKPRSHAPRIALPRRSPRAAPPKPQIRGR
jgi:hypothetical protein